MLVRLLVAIIFLFSLICEGQSSNCSSEDLLDGQHIETIVDRMPEYPGGMPELFKLISENLKYPKEQKEIQSKIFLSFVIDGTGHPRNICISKQFNENELTPLEKEAIKLFEKMKAWKPGELKGKKVPVRIQLPIIIDIG